MHRVELLSDRPEGVKPEGRQGYEYLIPLTEVIGSVVGVGPSSKRVRGIYDKLLSMLGPELHVLRKVEIEEIARCGEPLVAEGVRRMRTGEVEIHPGYDGEFGVVRVFSDEERERLKGQEALFEMPAVKKEAVGCEEIGTAKKKGAGREATGRAEKKEAVGGEETERGAKEEATGGKEIGRAAKEEATGGKATGRTGKKRAGEEGQIIASGELDAVQTRVVEAEGGPLVVVAGPGSGKTRTLTWRIAHLVKERGVRAEQVMAVTFTNRASGEMRERLQELLKEVAGLEGLRVGTFHSIALDLLREHGEDEKVVIDELEARRVLAGVIEESELELRPTQAQGAISLAKGAGLAADAVEGEEVQAAYRAYQERLSIYRARDYDDILLDLLELLERNPGVLGGIRECFPHLLVDEFQDVNAVQYRLVRLLAGDGQGLLVIGDPDQAIYGFRGAEPRFFSQLRRDFPGSQLFHLETNYRSKQNIVEAAAALIENNADREEMSLKAAQKSGRQIRWLSVPGETAEGIAVVREIGRMVGGADMMQSDQDEGSGTRSFGDFAVLFRTGRQAGLLEECFLKEGLPYRLIGQKGFLEAESVRAALAFCRYVLRPQDGLRLLHALELEPFRPSRSVLTEVWQKIGEGKQRSELPAAAVEKLQLIDKVAAGYGELSPGDFFRKWQKEYGAEDDADLEQLIRVADEAPSPEQFVKMVLLGKEADYERAGGDGQARSEAVKLMTLHAAKGLEFPVVFICGVEDGLVPYREKDADFEEERRLFYVGMTRAKEELVLLSARSRMRYGQRIQPDVSPFVRELPEELLDAERVEPPRREKAEQMSLF